jgi:hypothetical protein
VLDWLADAVLVLHFGFILFVVLGGLLVARWPKLAWVHLPAALWGLGIELSNGRCPLTPLENHLRRLAGGRGYEETFVEHYLLPWIYPAGLTRGVQLALAAAIVVVNLGTYALALRFLRSRNVSQIVAQGPGR